MNTRPRPTTIAAMPAMVGIGTTFCSSAWTLSGPTSSTVLRSVNETFSTTRPATPRTISTMPIQARGFMPSRTPIGGSGSLMHQELAALLDRRPGAGRELRVGGAADRMGDGREAVARHAQHPAHRLGGADEALGHDPEGGDSLFLGSDGVVQTAR